MERTKLSTQDGTAIETYIWKPEGTVRAVIILSHGIGEHGERYDHVAGFLIGHGIAFVGFDHRGHGRSGGKRGHIGNYGQLLEEIDLVKSEAEKQFGTLPTILYGHSWGATIALNYLLRKKHGFKAAIISGPWLILPPEQLPSPFLAFLAKIMNSIYPSFTENNQIDTSQLSSDPEVGKTYDKDPLVHGNVTAGNYIKSAQAAEYALNNASKLSIPTLLMHGADDKITSPKGSEAFAKTAGDHVQLHVWEGQRHEIHNEVKKGEVMEKMLGFIESHLA